LQFLDLVLDDGMQVQAKMLSILCHSTTHFFSSEHDVVVFGLPCKFQNNLNMLFNVEYVVLFLACGGVSGAGR
jgi:hypothetical protein